MGRGLQDMPSAEAPGQYDLGLTSPTMPIRPRPDPTRLDSLIKQLLGKGGWQIVALGHSVASAW